MSKEADLNLSLPKRLWLLFATFAKIAALVVGGGLAMLPVIEETFVKKYRLLDNDDVLDMVAVSQSVPGIIAANSAIFVGQKIAGVAGASVALFGAILPSFAVIVLIAAFFPDLNPHNIYLLGAFAGVKCVIAGLIAVTSYKLWRKTVKNRWELCAVAGFAVAAIAGVSPVLLILLGLIGGVVAIYLKPDLSGANKEAQK